MYIEDLFASRIVPRLAERERLRRSQRRIPLYLHTRSAAWRFPQLAIRRARNFAFVVGMDPRYALLRPGRPGWLAGRLVIRRLSAFALGPGCNDAIPISKIIAPDGRISLRGNDEARDLQAPLSAASQCRRCRIHAGLTLR